MKLKFSDEQGASKKVQKMSSDILRLANEFDTVIRKVKGKEGLSTYYEKNKETYDLALDQLLKAKGLMIEASWHLMGGREFAVP